MPPEVGDLVRSRNLQRYYVIKAIEGGWAWCKCIVPKGHIIPYKTIMLSNLSKVQED